MNRLWIVARWEFLSTVTRGSFIAMAVGLPLVHVGIAALMGFSLQAAQRNDKAAKPIAVVDASGVLREGQYGWVHVLRDEEAAMRELRDGRSDGVFVLGEDYLENGRLFAYAPRRPGLFGVAEATSRRERAADAIRRALMPEGISDSTRQRIASPASAVDQFYLDTAGRPVADSGSPLAMLGGAFGVCLLLSLSIFMASGLLQHAMATERENRMLEVLLASIPPLTLLCGKVLGLAGAGLLQVGVYLLVAVGGTPAMLGLTDIPAGTLVWSASCFAAGYVLFACLMGAVGALGRDTQESAQIATVWVLAGAAPMFFITFISADPDSLLARTLSWIPVTSPVALLLRIGAGHEPGAEFVGAMLLTFSAAAGALIAAASLLRRLAAGEPLLLGFRRHNHEPALIARL